MGFEKSLKTYIRPLHIYWPCRLFLNKIFFFILKTNSTACFSCVYPTQNKETKKQKKTLNFRNRNSRFLLCENCVSFWRSFDKCIAKGVRSRLAVVSCQVFQIGSNHLLALPGYCQIHATTYTGRRNVGTSATHIKCVLGPTQAQNTLNCRQKRYVYSIYIMFA